MSLSPGARLGPFEIIAKLGEGGMGEVYRANDTRLKRMVAIKVITESAPHGPDASRLDRFQQEARAIARINHSGICALYDVGQDGETTFLVMEYVPGETLSSRLAGGPLPLGVALRAAAQIADALDHAHRQGVTHRDLKPANIMLTRDGVKILDFGLAKLREEPAAARAHSMTLTAPAPLTEAGMIVGTVPYMSPEQIEGHAVDARSDIFSFGVVLYEMVTGRRPFAGDSRISLMAAIVGNDAPAPSTLQAAVPPALDRVIARCLAKDPDNRWQDARDLAAELRWLGEAGSGASPAAIASPRRSRRVLIVAGLGALGIAAVAIATTMMLRRSDAPVPTFSAVTFRRGLVTSARFASDGQSIIYSGSWQGGPHEVFVGQAGSADARSLELADGRILSVSEKNDLAVHFGPQVVTPQEGTLATVPFVGGARRPRLEQVIDADWIPGTDTLAVVHVPQDNGPSQLEFPIGTKIHEARAIWSLRVSPDGSRVAFFEGQAMFSTASRGMLTVIDRAGRKSTLARDLVGLGLAWAPSGDEIWFTASLGRYAPSLFAASTSGRVREVYHAPDWLVVHDIAKDGRVLMSRNSIRVTMSCQGPGETSERDLTWLFASGVNSISRDGRSAVLVERLGTDEPQVFQRQLDGAPAVPLGKGSPVPQGLSPDGKWVLMHDTDGLSLLPTGAGSPVRLPKGKLARIDAAGWLDETQVAFTGFDEGTAARPRIYVQTIRDGSPRPVTPEGVTLSGGAPTPDGRWILGRSGAVWQLFPLDQGPARPVLGILPFNQPLQWSRDGKFLFTADRSTGRSTSLDVYQVDVATGRRTLWKTLAPPDPVGLDSINPVVLSPDGSAYCYSHLRRLGDLFLVEGLK